MIVPADIAIWGTMARMFLPNNQYVGYISFLKLVKPCPKCKSESVKVQEFNEWLYRLRLRGLLGSLGRSDITITMLYSCPCGTAAGW